MRILFILEYYHPHTGGVETLFSSLVQQLDQQGHQVTVLTNLYDPQLASQESFGQRGAIIRKRYHNRYFFTFFAWFHALKLAKEVDIIHTTSYNAAIPARIAAWYRRKKSIITFHEVYGNLWYQLPWMSNIAGCIHKSFESFVCKLKFDRFVGVSNFTKERLLKKGVPVSKAMRIYNGIDYSDFPKWHNRGKEKFEILFFGRVGYAKGVDLLLQAYHQFSKDTDANDHRLTLIIPSEKTPLLRKMYEMMDELQLSANIVIRHDLPYSQLKESIAQASCVVIPSYSEGFCFAAVETMAIGTPIISSGRGALREVVTGQHITCQSFDSRALSKAMTEAYMEKWHHTPPKKYELQDTVNEYMQLYHSLSI